MSGSGQVVLVTGASSGFGRAAAGLLAERGAWVFGTSRRPDAEAARGVEMLTLDVRSDESAAACVEAVLGRTGRIDALVNNAGVAVFGESEATSLDQARAQFETNLFGVMRMVNTVLPAMRSQGAGRIVNLSSLAGLLAVPLMPLYTASKFALEGYSESLRYELRPLGVWVTLIEPAFTATGLLASTEAAANPVPAYDGLRDAARAAIADQAAGGPTPERVAETIARALAAGTPRLRYRVGRDAVWIPRLRAIAPPARYEAGARRKFGLGDA
jgi:NAD(P)-dependent dehydrogenase (short-subunit alcohol dehydrogenase family)